MLSRMRSLFTPTSLLTTVVCAAVAFVMSVLFRNYAAKAAVPLIFLLTLVPVALISGRIVSLFVATVASFIFAVYLSEPYGSLAIHNAVDRIDLLCFGLASIGVALFSPTAESLAESASQESSSRSSLWPLEGGTSLKASGLFENWIAIIGYAVVLMAIVTLLLYIWN